MIALPVTFSATSLFVVACLVRVALQNSVGSRYQILAYWLIAAAIEFISYASIKRVSALRGILHAAAGTAGVLLVKYIIEG